MLRRAITKLKKTNKAELDALKKRINFAIGVVIVLMSILVLRLWYLQILKGDEYARRSENNRVRLQWISAPRGNLLDRKGRLLVGSRPYFNVVLIREDAPEPGRVLQRLARILKVDVNVLLDRIRESSGLPPHVPIRLREDIDWRTLVYIEQHQYDLPGIRIEVQPSRTYPYHNLASHLIGYLGRINENEIARLKDEHYQPNDQIGKLGLEKIYEQILRGEKGKRYVEVNAQGFEQREINVQEPLPGDDLKLTIDLDLQQVAEHALEGKAGAAVVMEVNTGRVLVFASSPPLELEEFVGGISLAAWRRMQDNPLHPFINKVIQGQYPPGSTYKIVTALAGLGEGIITPETLVYCNGSMMLYGRRYHCWKRSGHGPVVLKKALAQSCDIYFYQTGLKVGVDTLAAYANSMGLGRKTGIRLEHEKAGLAPTKEWKQRRRKEAWQEGETLSVAIGQGFNLATPLQICEMTATLANGGTRYRPLVVGERLGPDGQVVESYAPEVMGHAKGTKAQLALIREGLIEAVNGKHGTGAVARLDDVLVAGKTGTAQVVRLKQYRHLREEDIPYKYRDHAWFTCFAPADNPEIAITVLVEHGRHGGSGAGPVARAILDAYFHGIKKDAGGKDTGAGGE